MKIEPMAGPSHAVLPNTQPTQSQNSSRERAIALLTGAAPINQNAIPSESMANAMPPRQEQRQDQRQAPKDEVLEADSGQNDTTDSQSTPEPEATETEAEKQRISAHYANLARKERQLLQRERDLKAREARQVPAQAPKDSTPVFDPKQYISRDELQKNTMSVLSEMGISYDQITQQALNAPSPETLEARNMIAELRNELKAVRESQENSSKSFQEQQQNAYQQTLKQFRNEATHLIKSDPAAYEVAHAHGKDAIDTIVKVIEDTYHQDGIIMSVEDAAREVEEYLAEEASKVARLKKIQARLRPATPTNPAVHQANKGAPAQPQMKTLTNQNSAPRQLSARERAIKRFHGESIE